MKILVGSLNPVKIEAVKECFEKYFSDVVVEGIRVESGVPAQPVGSETFDGAKNRALELKKINLRKKLNADFFVGIEGGIAKEYNIWFSFGAMCIVDAKGRTGFGTSPKFELPDKVVKELLNGTELGEVMDKIQNEKNTKQKKGAIGFFTKGKMTRKELYLSGLITALIPFLHDELFFAENPRFEE